ncbi:MAG: hypothetical protein WC489_04430 [Patescibacteria group bacterium]
MKLGDLIASAGDNAYDLLRQQYFWTIDETELVEETVHVATIASALILTNKWDSLDEARRLLRNPLQGMTCVEDLVYGPASFQHNYFPIVANGTDRSWHFTNYLYLIYEFLYLHKYRPEMAQELPNALRLYLALKTNGQDIHEQARELCDMAGYLYEISATIKNPKQAIFPALLGPFDDHVIGGGILDEEVGKDYRANRLGMMTALWLHNEIGQKSSWRQMRAGLRHLNDRYYKKPDMEPFFPPPLYLPSVLRNA